MNLCINLENNDFSQNVFEKGIRKWITETEKFYVELKQLIDKLKSLEIKIKNNYNDFDEIKKFFSKTKILNQESILLNFNRDFFSSLKEYIKELQKNLNIQTEQNHVLESKDENRISQINFDNSQEQIEENNSEIFIENRSLNVNNCLPKDSSIFIPKYYLQKIQTSIKGKYRNLKEFHKTENKLYFSAIDHKKTEVLIKVINKEKTPISHFHRLLSSYAVIKPQSEIIRLLEAKDIDNEMLILVFDKAGTALESLVVDSYPEGMNESLIFYLFNQIYSGLKYLHDQHVCLKSLSPANVLFQDFSLKISKFSDSVDTKVMNSIDRTFWRKIDVFGLGLVLFFMIFAKYPFESVSNRNMEISILDIDMIINKQERKIGNDLRLLLVKLLANSEERFNLNDVEQCRWFTNNLQKLNKMKKYYEKQNNEFFFNYFKFEK